LRFCDAKAVIQGESAALVVKEGEGEEDAVLPGAMTKDVIVVDI
jgi:hypothetical protein